MLIVVGVSANETGAPRRRTGRAGGSVPHVRGCVGWHPMQARVALHLSLGRRGGHLGSAVQHLQAVLLPALEGWAEQLHARGRVHHAYTLRMRTADHVWLQL
jgi:hypothetical protein